MPITTTSIQAKLLRTVLITSSVVLVLTCAAFFVYEFFFFRQSTKDQIFTLGNIIGYNSRAAITFDYPDDATETLNSLKAEKHIVAAAIYDTSGRLFVNYSRQPGNASFPPHPGQNGYRYAGGYLQGFQPILNSEKTIGFLYLKSDLTAFTARYRLYGTIALLVFIVSIVIAYFLSRRLQRNISGPIKSLAATAGTISKHQDYSVRAAKVDNDEIGVLTDAFNFMLQQIETKNAEITTLNHALEQKVAARTSDLIAANEELRLRREFVETIIDSSVDVIAVFDKELNYLVLNKYGEDFYGLRSAEVLGRNLLDVFPGVVSTPMYRDMQKARQGQAVHDKNYKSIMSGRTLENFYVPLKNKQNEVYSILVIGHDITEIVEAHEQLKTLNADLERSNRDLEQFAYVASHDLQEPLRKIMTFSSLLAENKHDEKAVNRYLAKVIDSAARMSDLIKAVLNYSHLTGLSEKVEQVDLNEVITGLLNDFELLITEKDVVIKCDSMPRIEGNALQLQQLFFNLIGNAIKFSDQKPEITVKCATITRQETAANGLSVDVSYLQVTIADNGIGFEQEHADRIFHVFQRLHNSDKYPGTGIGLALCKKIIENHHGDISVTSVPGKGTTFTVLLPMVQQKDKHSTLANSESGMALQR